MGVKKLSLILGIGGRARGRWGVGIPLKGNWEGGCKRNYRDSERGPCRPSKDGQFAQNSPLEKKTKKRKGK